MAKMTRRAASQAGAKFWLASPRRHQRSAWSYSPPRYFHRLMGKTDHSVKVFWVARKPSSIRLKGFSAARAALSAGKSRQLLRTRPAAAPLTVATVLAPDNWRNWL